MRAATLDIATLTGWCALVDGERESGVWNLAEGCPKGGEYIRHPHILGRLARLLGELIDRRSLDFIIIEEGFSRGPGSQLLHRLIGVAMAVAQMRGLGVVAVPGGTWKKAILGSGGLKSEVAKAASIAHAKTLQNSIVDDNHADAVCLSDYAERYLFSNNLTPCSK